MLAAPLTRPVALTRKRVAAALGIGGGGDGGGHDVDSSASEGVSTRGAEFRETKKRREATDLEKPVPTTSSTSTAKGEATSTAQDDVQMTDV